MPLHPDDPAARLQALEVGVVALQADMGRRVARVLAGDTSAEALLALAFACSEQAALLLHLAAVMQGRADAPTGPAPPGPR